MNKDVPTTHRDDVVDELHEDMILVGPGQILREARKNLSLTQQAVADKLNFRAKLITDIENDTFDHNLPATFNRGYLRNYAKLVAVDVEEVLAAYDLLGTVEVQRSEMQSFSNLTEKQAEHSRLMWLSYLIIAILLGLMGMWWMQTPASTTAEISKTTLTIIDNTATADTTTIANKPETVLPATSTESLLVDTDKNASVEQVIENNQQPPIQKIDTQVQVNEPQSVMVSADKKTAENPQPPLELATAVFTFSGDCWVNIYDATGERIAWGVKKSGYVMTISGQAPLKVTLGKPELAAISYNGEPIDMSPFNVGNIAKFTLPLSPL